MLNKVLTTYHTFFYFHFFLTNTEIFVGQFIFWRTKEAYRRNTIYQNSYFMTLIILLICLTTFFQTPTVIFMLKPIGIAPLIFYQELSSPIKKRFLTSPETLKFGWNLTENAVIIFLRKFSNWSFCNFLPKTLASNVLKTKMTFLNPAKHEN